MSLRFFLSFLGVNSISKQMRHRPESDHSALSLVIHPNPLNQKRGPGIWKFNAALLKDVAYVTAL